MYVERNQMSEVQVSSASFELLRYMMTKRIDKLIRYSWWPAEESVVKASIGSNEVFSLTAGPLAIVFENGYVVGVSSDPTLNSVILWAEEKDNKILTSEESMREIEDLFPVLNADPIYSQSSWADISQSIIVGYELLKYKHMNAIQLDRPSERGLRVLLNTGKSFILSHGLHNYSDDFSVIIDNQIDDFDEVVSTPLL